MMTRPDPSECAPYYNGYISEVGEGDIIEILRNQLVETTDLLRGVSEETGVYRYQPDKWSVKEVIGHLIDAERVFAYRALCFARNDKNPLPSMEQDDYVKFSNFDSRFLRDLLEEFRHVRLSSILLFESFDDEVLMRKGTASGFEFTVRTFPYIIAGHEKHHQRILKERYL